MPAVSQDFAAVFERLKEIFKPFAKNMVVTKDNPKAFYLETGVIDQKKRSICFGAVTWVKNYVSFHLMPIYGCPDLVQEMSPELKKRMQGKSCFNFKEVDEGLFQELATLTKKGYQRFKKIKLAR